MSQVFVVSSLVLSEQHLRREKTSLVLSEQHGMKLSKHYHLISSERN